MTESGSIAQYSGNDQFGMIHAGGTDHAAFLSFGFDDCSGPVQQQLQQGNIPPNSGFAVTFDVVFRDGGLVAVNVR